MIASESAIPLKSWARARAALKIILLSVKHESSASKFSKRTQVLLISKISRNIWLRTLQNFSSYHYLVKVIKCVNIKIVKYQCTTSFFFIRMVSLRSHSIIRMSVCHKIAGQLHNWNTIFLKECFKEKCQNRTEKILSNYFLSKFDRIKSLWKLMQVYIYLQFEK